MTMQHRLAHSGFTLTRDYPAPLERTWDAFADAEQKRAWWGGSDRAKTGEWAFDFRVGGRDVYESELRDAVVRYEATYTDIVEHLRIVTAYDMWIDGAHMSTSITSMEFEPTASGTRFTHVEHGVFFESA